MAKGLYERWTTKEGQTLLKGWRRKGLTDEQIAKKIGIACSTLYDWKNKHSEIAEALKKGKELCDYEAEETLIGLFEGHYVTDTITDISKGENGEEKKHIRQQKRWIEPNLTAIIFYLKCRAGWKEQAVEDQTQVLADLHDLFKKVKRDAEEEG